MNNADLAFKFLKKCQEWQEKGVQNDMAILVALYNMAEYKDKEMYKNKTEK